jgi:hypothetical protein
MHIPFGVFGQTHFERFPFSSGCCAPCSYHSVVKIHDGDTMTVLFKNTSNDFV